MDMIHKLCAYVCANTHTHAHTHTRPCTSTYMDIIVNTYSIIIISPSSMWIAILQQLNESVLPTRFHTCFLCSHYFQNLKLLDLFVRKRIWNHAPRPHGTRVKFGTGFWFKPRVGTKIKELHHVPRFLLQHARVRITLGNFEWEMAQCDA